jgi:SAM-dependent methyltransferase
VERFYDRQQHRLIYVERRADAAFWDEHWQTGDLAAAVRSGRDSLVVPETRRRLPPGATILEGGCGNGRYVHALRAAGYRCIGLDFAVDTLRQVHAVAPDLPLVAGDVFALPVRSASVDGYWSLGVIEHFWGGFEPVRDEMRRVIKPGGFLFLTHPYLSPLRRAKARLGGFPILSGPDAPAGFYQFALDGRRTVASFAQAGFTHVSSRPLFGDWGLGAEVACLKAPLGRLARSRRRGPRTLARIVNRAARPVAGHAVLHVLRRAGT